LSSLSPHSNNYCQEPHIHTTATTTNVEKEDGKRRTIKTKNQFDKRRKDNKTLRKKAKRGGKKEKKNFDRRQ
jgi:hypothetical protein